MSTTQTDPTTRSRRGLVIGAIITAVVVIGIALWLVFGDAPAEVSIEDAAGAASTETAADSSTTGTSSAISAGGVQGTWTVTTDAQPYSLEDSTGTFVGFRIAEELSRVGAATAVGRTPEVTVGEVVGATAVGDLTVNGVTQPVEVPLEAGVADNGLLVVTGTIDVLLSDYGVTAPSAPIVVSVSDEETVEIQLYLTPG